MADCLRYYGDERTLFWAGIAKGAGCEAAKAYEKVSRVAPQ